MPVRDSDVLPKIEFWQKMVQSAQSQVNDPAIGDRLAGYQQKFWWMPSDAMFSLAKAGITADSDVGSQAGMAAAHLAAQTIGFDRMGGPIPKVNELPDLTGAGQAFDDFVNGSAVPHPTQETDVSKYAAGPSLQVKDLAGDEAWNKLDPQFQDQLNNVKFTPFDAAGGKARYKVDGVDTLTPEVFDELTRILSLHQLGRQSLRTGPWATHQVDNNGKVYIDEGLNGATNVTPEQRQAYNDQKFSGPNLISFDDKPFNFSPDIGSTPGEILAHPLTSIGVATQMGGVGIPEIAPVLRAGFVGLSAPIQEGVGQYRNLYEYAVHDTNPNWLQSQSDLGIAVGDLLGGRDVDLGEGIFAGGKVAEERQRRELQRGNIGGEAITPGRFIADEYGLAPGSKPFQILSGLTDFAVAIKLDPAAFALKGASELHNASKVFTEAGSIGKAVNAYRETGQVGEGLHAFTEAGGLLGVRPTISRDVALTWMTAPEQAGMRQALVDSESPWSIWNALGRQADPRVAKALAAATDEQGVLDALLPEMGVSIRSKPNARDMGLNPSILTRVRNSIPALEDTGVASVEDPIIFAKPKDRWTAPMPHSSMDVNNPYQMALEAEAWGAATKQTHQVPKWFDDLAATETPLQRVAWWERVQKDTYGALISGGDTALHKQVAEAEAQRLVQIWNKNEQAGRIYATNKVSKGLGSFDDVALVDGKFVTLQSRPHDLLQHLNGPLPIPPVREVRRAMSDYSRIFNYGPVVTAGDAALWAQNFAWKLMQIATLKTGIKVVGDEQFGIGARRYDSLVNHPLSALSAILATPLSELPEDAGFFARLSAIKTAHADGTFQFGDLFGIPTAAWASTKHGTLGGLRSAVEHLPGVDAEGTLRANLLGEAFAHTKAVQKFAGHGIDSLASDRLGVIVTDHWDMIPKAVDDPKFLNAWARNVAHFNATDDIRGVVQAGSLEQAQSWYMNSGTPLREELAKSGAKGHPELLTEAGANKWVQDSLDQVHAQTNGNPALIEAISTGKLDGVPMWETRGDGSLKINDEFVNKLKDHFDDAPHATKGEVAVYSPDLARKQITTHYFDRILHTLLSSPSYVLSKSPLFRQAYWKRAVELAPFMAAEDQVKLIKLAAGEANIGPRLSEELYRVIQRNPGVEHIAPSAAHVEAGVAGAPFVGVPKSAGQAGITLADAHTISENFAADMVRRTTHEFSNKSQAMDMIRVLSPFGEVWRKTMLRWANIIKENWAVPRRFQQIVEGARGQDLGAFTGNPAGQGFFHKDQYGQEVFTIPGSEFLSQALVGQPIPFTGNAMGLSVGFEFFPAIGPAASIPVAWTLQKLHTPKAIMDEIFPYGEPKGPTDLMNYAPTWVKSAFGYNRPTSPEAVSVYNHTVIDMLRYGVTNDDYDFSTPEGIQSAWEDATSKANRLYALRGAMQFVVPGAPSPEFMVRDKGGKLIDAALLVEEYRNLSDPKKKDENGVPGDPNTAGERFLAKYGSKVFTAVGAKTYAFVFGVPSDERAAAWVDEHHDVRTKFAHVYGYFAPPSDPDSFDYNIYRQSLDRGERLELEPRLWAKVQNSRLAALEFGQLRDRIVAKNGGKPPDDGQRQWLAEKKQQLIDHYPGYAEALYGGSGLPDRPDPKLLVGELYKAVKDPTVKETEAGIGLKYYLKRRDEADARWVAAGFHSGSWTDSQGAYAVQLRNWLRQKGSTIQEAYPEFGPLFEDVFTREMRDDTKPGDVSTDQVAPAPAPAPVSLFGGGN